LGSLKDETGVTQDVVYGFGPYALDAAARRLTRDGEPVALSPKSYEVLLLLVSNSGRALSREEILETVWPDTIVEAGNLDWHVSALRKALSDSRDAIETVRGFGYRFGSEVAAETPAIKRSDPVIQVPAPASVPSPPPMPRQDAERPRLRLGSWRWLALAAAAVAAVIVLRLPPRTGGGPRFRKPPTVAVLAFENLSPDAQTAWLSLALRELLAAELSQSANVTMIPGETVAHAIGDLGVKGGTLSVQTLGRLRQALGTDVVVSGSYVVVGQERKLRVVSNLQDCVSAQSLATVEQNGTVEEMLALVSQVGARLRSPFEAREPSLKAQQGGAGFATGPEALRLYIEGLGRLRDLKTLEARDLLLRATELDPTFALAHSALADAWAELGYERKAADEAKAAVERSASLSREERLLIEGRHEELANHWQRAVEVYQALVTFFPESVDYGLKLAAAETRGKKAREALRTLETLRRFPEPKGSDPRIDIARGWAARWLGDFAGMDAAGREAERKGRALALPHLIAQGLYLRAWASVSTSRPEETVAASTEGAKLAREIGDVGLATNHLSVRGYALDGLGRFAESRAAFQEGLAAARGIGYMQSVRTILSGLSQLEAECGNLEEAEREAREGVEICQTTGDSEGEVSALLDVSRVQCAKGDVESAKALATQALEKSRSVAIDRRIANSQLELGRALLLAGEFPAARAALSEALRLRAKETGNRRAFVRMRLARLALEEGAAAEGLAFARSALSETALPGEAPGEEAGEAHAMLAEALAASGDEGARQELASAAAVIERFAGVQERMDLQLARGRTLARLGARAEARSALSDASAIAKEHGFGAASLEARIRLARLDAAERVSGAVPRLAALESEARSRGYGLLLGRAR
jgi:DNA-binding winged helix-turn-helix (wHTH) protein/tetratricopeptide (TPR) repeat protein